MLIKYNHQLAFVVDFEPKLGAFGAAYPRVEKKT